MGQQHFSRRAVLQAGEAAKDALEQQREMFRLQQEAMHKLEAMVGKLNARILQLERDATSIGDRFTEFEGMTAKERARWIATGKTPRSS